MNRVCFVTGAEDSRDYPSDTPEAYWRAYLPGKTLGTAAILGHPKAAERALAAQVVWIYEPTCFAAASLAEVARQMGKPVVIDFAEDPWARSEIDSAYNSHRLEAVERTLAAARVIVVATPGLADLFAPYGPVRVVESVLPLTGWVARAPTKPPLLGWWCDERQRSGLEEVAGALRGVLSKTSAHMTHIGFVHQAPIMRGLVDKEAIANRTGRLSSFRADDLHLTVEANLQIFRTALAGCYVSLECYPAGAYQATVSDIPLLRAAALGVPSVTTRAAAPPGSISAAPEDWEATVLQLLSDSTERRRLSFEARAWAETRTTHEAYQATLTEVLP